MSRKRAQVTAAELRIMKVLWQRGPSTVRQCLDALSLERGDTPAYTTVMTMMTQLAEKGVLNVDRARQPYVYTPAIRRDQVLRQRLSQFLQTVFDGQVEDLVLHLAEETDLSSEDLRRIEAKIRAREEADGTDTTGSINQEEGDKANTNISMDQEETERATVTRSMNQKEVDPKQKSKKKNPKKEQP
jgi:predicted transcriptional regulator